MGVGGQLYAPAAFPRERAQAPIVIKAASAEGLELEGCGEERTSCSSGVDLRTFQPVASLYTD